MTNLERLIAEAHTPGLGGRLATEELGYLFTNYGPALVEALREYDALIENLWKAVPWGSTCGLDMAALNRVPLRAKRLLATIEKEAGE